MCGWGGFVSGRLRARNENGNQNGAGSVMAFLVVVDTSFLVPLVLVLVVLSPLLSGAVLLLRLLLSPTGPLQFFFISFTITLSTPPLLLARPPPSLPFSHWARFPSAALIGVVAVCRLSPSSLSPSYCFVWHVPHPYTGWWLCSISHSLLTCVVCFLSNTLRYMFLE